MRGDQQVGDCEHSTHVACRCIRCNARPPDRAYRTRPTPNDDAASHGGVGDIARRSNVPETQAWRRSWGREQAQKLVVLICSRNGLRDGLRDDCEAKVTAIVNLERTADACGQKRFRAQMLQALLLPVANQAQRSVGRKESGRGCHVTKSDTQQGLPRCITNHSQHKSETSNLRFALTTKGAIRLGTDA